MKWTPPNQPLPNRRDRRRAKSLRRSQDDNHVKQQLTAAKKRPAVTGNASLTLTAAAAISENPDGLPTFEIEAYTGGLMYPNLSGIYYDGPVVVDISGIEVADKTNGIPVHREHDASRPVGHTQVELGATIVCKGVFSVVNADSEEIRSSSKNGFPWRGSIGLGNMRYEFVDPGMTAQANGQTFDGPLLVVRGSILNEVSFVTVAGDPKVRPAIAANKSAGVQPMNFSAWLKAQGFDESTLNDAQLKTLRAAFDAEQAAAEGEGAGEGTEGTTEGAGASTPEGEGTATEPATNPTANATATASRNASLTANRATNSLQAQREQAAAEEERIAGIREIGQSIGDPVVTEQGANGARLVAHAIRHGWDVNQTALYATRNVRPRTPSIHTTSPSARGSIGALQAAILLRAGRPIDRVTPSHYMVPGWMSRPVNDAERQRVMDDAQEFRDCTMMELTANALRAMGHSVPSGRNHHATLQAAFTTGSVSALYEQTIGSMAIASYMEAGDFSLGWTTENDELNLEEHSRPRLESASDLTIQPETAEADHSKRSANAEKVKVDRFSRQAEIDEIAFINDNFSLLRQTPVDFGRAAARLRPTLVASVLMGNAAMSDTVALFHANHNNVLPGSALAQGTLQAGRAKLGKQMDGDASLNLPATHLIVPTDLGDLAVQLTKSVLISNDGGAGNMNSLASRGITPVEEARLANGVTDPRSKTPIAGSGTTWYLASAEGHTIEVQFLAGTGRVPVVVVTQLTGGKFGLNIVVKHFVGSKALDFRGMLRAQA
jgi:hypothetical protein